MQFQHCIRRDAYHYMAEHTTARTVCLHIDFHSVMQAVQFGFFGRDMDMAPGDNHAVVFHHPPFRTDDFNARRIQQIPRHAHRSFSAQRKAVGHRDFHLRGITQWP
ncbi:hypothetical protein ExPCM15_04395 [Escherichia coli]|nr:hypothetical protein ExPCM15_04395 [Escherichia coli]